MDTPKHPKDTERLQNLCWWDFAFGGDKPPAGIGCREAEIWKKAVEEAHLQPKDISKFGQFVGKLPASWMHKIGLMNHTKDIRYNFVGKCCSKGVDEYRKWVWDLAKSSFNEQDLLIFTDPPSGYEPLGTFDLSLTKGGFSPGLNMDDKAWAEMDDDYFKQLTRSNFTLAPRGNHPFSYRFYEAAVTHSIPVLSAYDFDLGPRDWIRMRDVPQMLRCIGYHYYTLDDPQPFAYRKDWAEENYRLFIKYQTFMEGDNQPPGAAGTSPLPACEGRLLPPGQSGRGGKVLLVVVGLFRSIADQWPKLKRRLVDPQTRAGYTFEIVVHTSTADSDVRDAAGALRRLLEPWDATVVDRVDGCTMLTPNMQPGERCVHADLPGTRRISCGTMHFASRAVHALKPYMHDPGLDKVLVIRSDRHLVPDPPPEWSHVAPGYAGPVGTAPVPASWSFSFGDACREHPGVSIVGSAQITNGFAADHDPDWAWLLCDPSRLDLFVEALASAGLPCSPGCRPPYAAAPSKAGKSWLSCDGGWCRSAEVLDGKIEFGTLKGYALASV